MVGTPCEDWRGSLSGFVNYNTPCRIILTAQGLPSTPLYQVSANYPKVNYGGILYFRVKATAETPAMILDNFKLVSRGRSVSVVQDQIKTI